MVVGYSSTVRMLGKYFWNIPMVLLHSRLGSEKKIDRINSHKISESDTSILSNQCYKGVGIKFARVD